MEISNAYLRLLAALPLHSAEGGESFAVTVDELHRSLACIDGVCPKTLIGVMSSMLTTCSLLDEAALSAGEWKFISYPAQLMARSLIQACADPDSKYFPVDHWNTLDISKDSMEQQRQTLRALEDRRVEYHQQALAEPIRYIYVAWSVIKLDGCILFYRREDTQLRNEDKAGNYGLIGGRCHQKDLKIFAGTAQERINELQGPNSSVALDALDETLKREILEESGLSFGLHYEVKPWLNLKPFQQAQGAAPVYAYTEYYFKIHLVQLTLKGYLRLKKLVDEDRGLHFAWFTPKETAAGENSHGQTAYIQTIYNEFNNDRDAVQSEFEQLANSYTSPELLNTKLSMNFTPERQQFKIGKSHARVLTTLSDGQYFSLLGLAAHAKGLAFERLVNGVILYESGWIGVENNASLQEELISLAIAFNTDAGHIIENDGDNLFRLAVIPEDIAISADFFKITRTGMKDDDIPKNNNGFYLLRDGFETAAGKTASDSKFIQSSFSLSNEVIRLALTGTCNGQDGLYDRYAKAIHPQIKSMGLKQLISGKNGRNSCLVSFHAVD